MRPFGLHSGVSFFPQQLVAVLLCSCNILLSTDRHVCCHFLYSGPFLAILAALGGKYAADKNQGPIRDASIGIGRIASAAYKKAEEERLLYRMKASVYSLFRKHERPDPDELKASEGHSKSRDPVWPVSS